jgi:hypothetical protein
VVLRREGGDRQASVECRHLAGHAAPDAGPGVNSKSTKVITGGAGSLNGKVAGNTPYNTHHNIGGPVVQQTEGAPRTRSATPRRVRRQ